jgi:hypothetical protein
MCVSVKPLGIISHGLYAGWKTYSKHSYHCWEPHCFLANFGSSPFVFIPHIVALLLSLISRGLSLLFVVCLLHLFYISIIMWEFHLLYFLLRFSSGHSSHSKRTRSRIYKHYGICKINYVSYAILTYNLLVFKMLHIINSIRDRRCVKSIIHPAV